MKIYTKTGDKGTTRLVDGSCVAKHNPRVEAYGSIDELNSYVGIIISELKKIGPEMNTPILSLEKTQHHLFRLGSLVASGDLMSSENFNQLPQISPDLIEQLERNVDDLTQDLEPLKNFILPSGSHCISHIHFLRTLCRRSERRVAEVYSEQPERLQNSLIYLNRLSDYLFTLARWVALKNGVQEIKWDQTL